MRFRIRGSARHQILIIVCPTSFLSPLMLPTAATAYQQPVQSRLHNDLRPRTHALPTNRIAYGVQPSTVLRPMADSIAVSRASSLAKRAMAFDTVIRDLRTYVRQSSSPISHRLSTTTRDLSPAWPIDAHMKNGTYTCMYHRTHPSIIPSFFPVLHPTSQMPRNQLPGASPTSTHRSHTRATLIAPSQPRRRLGPITTNA